MSGIVHAVGSVFHAVTHAVGHIFHEVATHWEEIALVAAAVYTGGVAMGYWGAGSAASGVAAAGATGTGLGGMGATVGDMTGNALAGTVGTTLGGAATTAPFASLAASVATAGSAAAGTTSFLGELWNGAKTVGSTVMHGMDTVGHAVGSFFGMGAPAGAAGSAASGGMASWMKMSLLSTGMNMIGAYMASKPVPPNNFFGRGPGGGVGIGMHAINGGFGIAPGGSTPAPKAIPPSLLNPGGGFNQPPSLSDAAQATPQNGQQPGNLGQTAANAAGVGGLIPQGPVNFMGNPNG